MNKENVYIGVYSDCKESLFYKISDRLYYDLKSYKKVNANELSSIVSFTSMFPTRIKSVFGIIQLYNIDRMKPINLQRTFIGDITRIGSIQEFERDDGTFYLKLVHEEERKDILLYKCGNDIVDNQLCCTYLDIESNNIWSHYRYPIIGNYHISVQDRFATVTSDDSLPKYITKAKLLEKYRKYKQDALNNR